MIRDVLSIFDNEAKIEKLFNQKRDIIHYRRNRFHASTIETLIMLRMHTNRHNAILLIDITDHDLNLNSDFDTKVKTNDQRDKNIYIKASLFDAFLFSILKIENFIDVENQESEIDYLSENNFVLISENNFQNELSSQASTLAKKISKKIRSDRFFIEISNKRNV